MTFVQELRPHHPPKKICLRCVRADLELKDAVAQRDAARAELERWKLVAAGERRAAVAFLLEYAKTSKRDLTLRESPIDLAESIGRGMHVDAWRDGDLDEVIREALRIVREPAEW